jgi:hypothetical protein
MSKIKKRRTFKCGDVVTFDFTGFNASYWDSLSEKDRKRHYGPFGYGAKRLKTFVFLTEINDCPGHCVLIDMDQDSKQKVVTMVHTDEFRNVTEDEV